MTGFNTPKFGIFSDILLLSFDGFFSKMFSHPFYRKPATCFATSGWHNFPASDFRRVAKENHPFLQLLELSGIPTFKFLIIRSVNNHIPYFLVHCVAKVYAVLPFYDVKCLCSGGRE